MNLKLSRQRNTSPRGADNESGQQDFSSHFTEALTQLMDKLERARLNGDFDKENGGKMQTFTKDSKEVKALVSSAERVLFAINERLQHPHKKSKKTGGKRLVFGSPRHLARFF